MSPAISAYLAVAIGGAIGSVTRFWLTGAVAALTGPRFPWGTLLINVVGSFVIGQLAPEHPHPADDRVLRRLHHLLGVQPANAGIDTIR